MSSKEMKGDQVSDAHYPLPTRKQLREARQREELERAAQQENAALEDSAPEDVATPVTVALPEDPTPEDPAPASPEVPPLPKGRVGPFGYALRAVLILGLATATVALPMTGRVGSDSSLSVPARAMGVTQGRATWAGEQTLPQATALDGTLTAASRARANAPVSLVGCATVTGADGNRAVNVVPDTIYWPLPAGTFTITSPFAMRISPVSGQLLAHEGIDMAAPMDTPITSVYAGVVTEVAENSRSGAYVVIRHTKSDGTIFYSAYLHQYMNRITVAVGDSVTAGQVIGAVGSNGWSTGPHLHFEIRDSADQPVDPEVWMEENRAIYLGQEACS